VDSVERQKRFADVNSFDYPLLSEVDGEVADRYGVRRGKIGRMLGAPVKRWTFAIGTDGKIVRAVSSETDMRTHADSALAALRS
jgi:peroxiredoxin Q/BCP